MTLRWLPNAICVARILLAAPIAVALLRRDYPLTLALFGLAAASDGIDGWLAKTFGWTSRLGKILDPLADKALLVSVIVMLVFCGLVPLWLAAAVVLRDVVIVGGAMAYHFLIGYVEGRPTVVSKLNTVVQLTFILAVVAAAAWPRLPKSLLVALGAATFVTTVVSGLDYVLTYGRLAVLESRRQGASAR
jgi:cardiolipin synthase